MGIENNEMQNNVYVQYFTIVNIAKNTFSQ
jgi:hypothetical protein